MSFRNVIITGGLCLAGLALLMDVADRQEGGLLPGSAKAPRGGGGLLSAPFGGDDAARDPAPADPESADPEPQPEPRAPLAQVGDLVDRLADHAVDALRAARAAGDQVFGRAPLDKAPAPEAD
ncbi:MAG: hypothetical protein AAGI51_07515 [Pseudomonadota bacterium]